MLQILILPFQLILTYILIFFHFSQKLKNENDFQNWYPTLKIKKTLQIQSHENSKSQSKIDTVQNLEEKESENISKSVVTSYEEENVFLTASSGLDRDVNLEEVDIGEETDSRQFSDSIIEDSESENNPATFELLDLSRTIELEMAKISKDSKYRENKVSLIPYEFRMKRNPLSSINNNDFKIAKNPFIEIRSKPLSSNSSICSSSLITLQIDNQCSLHKTNRENGEAKGRDKNDNNDKNDKIGSQSAFILSENQSDENMKKSWHKLATHKINLSKSKADTHWNILRIKQHSLGESDMKPFSQDFKVRTNPSFSSKFFESPDGK